MTLWSFAWLRMTDKQRDKERFSETKTGYEYRYGQTKTAQTLKRKAEDRITNTNSDSGRRKEKGMGQRLSNITLHSLAEYHSLARNVAECSLELNTGRRLHTSLSPDDITTANNTTTATTSSFAIAGSDVILISSPESA